jgi:hypothetical protein
MKPYSSLHNATPPLSVDEKLPQWFLIKLSPNA